jgi:hypothetical protein
MSAVKDYLCECGHPMSCHGQDGCEVEVSDYGVLDCSCERVCAACVGDPEAHDLHVCGRDGDAT